MTASFRCWGLGRDADIGAMHEEEAARHYVQAHWECGDGDDPVRITVMDKNDKATYWLVSFVSHASPVGEAREVASPFD